MDIECVLLGKGGGGGGGGGGCGGGGWGGGRVFVSVCGDNMSVAKHQ